MATAAAMLRHRGCDVSGSDPRRLPADERLSGRRGHPNLERYRPEHITQRSTWSSSAMRSHGEIRSSKRSSTAKIRTDVAARGHSATQFLWGARSIVIAGTHGKTTTTALAGWLLTSAGIVSEVLVGGIASNFGERGRLSVGGRNERVCDRRRRIRQISIPKMTDKPRKTAPANVTKCSGNEEKAVTPMRASFRRFKIDQVDLPAERGSYFERNLHSSETPSRQSFP